MIKKIVKPEDKKALTKRKIKNLLKKNNPVILEIGANTGVDTKEFLDEFRRIKIFCFEPDERAIKRFKKRVKDKRCELFEIAISSKNGQTTFYVSDGKGPKKGWNLSSSIKKPKNHLKLNPDITFDKKMIVKTKRLDTWAKENKIGRIDFIWADVQGAERELIKGGIKTLNNKTKYFYTEFSNDELYEGQPTLDEICQLLPNFKIIEIFGDDVLLKNNNLN
ncbi:FkbM family methyltransferase [Candidatus Pacearchaeota archaeon]|nr:FkbM family methyltransferase [Candidatus Pacearchaeota archaeon]